jgi:hypothetical protein
MKVSYQQFMESYAAKKSLSESRYNDEDEYTYNDAHREASSGIPSKANRNDSVEDLTDQINDLHKQVSSYASGNHKRPGYDFEEINGIVAQKNLTPQHKAKLMSIMTLHNMAVDKHRNSETLPSEYATDVQERHLFGKDYDKNLATLPDLYDLHDDHVSAMKERHMSETDRVFGSEAGYNRYRHG